MPSSEGNFERVSQAIDLSDNKANSTMDLF